MAKLILSFKGANLKEIPLDKLTLTIGRKPENDICIENLAVSGYHAKIVQEGPQVFIEDLNSLNGTFVNNKKIARCVLKHDDKIVIGKHMLLFISDKPGAEAPPQPEKKEDLEKTMVLDTKEARAMGAGAPKAAGKTGTFTVIEGAADQGEYELKGKVTIIGKSDTAAIKLKGLLTPKVAALVNQTAEGFFISPSEKGSKIKVNGDMISARHALKDGDIVELYGLKMQFSAG